MADLPSGIKLETGLLVFNLEHPVTAGGSDSSVIARFAPGLGAGFAIGLHGYSVVPNVGAPVSGDGWRWELGTDQDTTAIGDGTNNDVVYSRAINQIVITSGTVFSGNFGATEPVHHSIPILVVKNVISRFNPLIVPTNAQVSIYYSIYSVTDAQFLRVAGISLASGRA